MTRSKTVRHSQLFVAIENKFDALFLEQCNQLDKPEQRNRPYEIEPGGQDTYLVVLPLTQTQ